MTAGSILVAIIFTATSVYLAVGLSISRSWWQRQSWRTRWDFDTKCAAGWIVLIWPIFGLFRVVSAPIRRFYEKGLQR